MNLAVKSAQLGRMSQTAATAGASSHGHTLESNGLFDWLHFFLQAGIPANDAERYSSAFKAQAVDKETLDELNNDWLARLGVTNSSHQNSIVQLALKTLGKTTPRKIKKPAPRPSVPLSSYTRSLLSALPLWSEESSDAPASSPATTAAVVDPPKENGSHAYNAPLPTTNAASKPYPAKPTMLPHRGLRSSSEVLFLLSNKPTTVATTASRADMKEDKTGAMQTPTSPAGPSPALSGPTPHIGAAARMDPIRYGFKNFFNMMARHGKK